MDPNQQGQPTQGGSVPPTSSMPGIPPEQTSGMPPASTDMQSTSATQPTSPVFSTGPATSPTASPQPSDPAPSSMPFTARRFSQSAGPAAFQPSQQQTIASSTGSAAPKKGLSKGMIIGLIAIAILAIAAVVTGIIVSQSSGNKSSTASTTSAPINMAELTTAYNNLANYIAFGDEGTSEKKLSDGKTYTTYELLLESVKGYQPEPILEADKMLEKDNSAEKSLYFQNYERLYKQLPESLYSEHSISIDSIQNFYQGFSSIGIISPSSIISRYNTEGFENTKNNIENTVVTNSDLKAIGQYANFLREYDIAFLELINDVKTNFGCVVTVNNTNKCDISSASSYENFTSKLSNIQTGEAYDIKSDYHQAAIQALLNIYALLNDNPIGSRQ